MADSKITALASIGTGTDPANDPLVIVDVSDILPGGMSLTGTTKKVTLNNLLACSPTATLASATISGDLTVKTNVMRVDTTNNRVGVLTASPSAALHVNGVDTTNVLFNGLTKGIRFVSNASTSQITGVDNTGSASYQPLSIGGSALDFSLSGSTAMTLNATGLGVGTSPSFKLDVLGSATISGRFRTSGALNALYFEDGGTTPNSLYIGTSGDTFRIITGNSVRMNVDLNGNVGIGVTPAGTGGCLQLKSGITFPATQVASSDANTLDDYEEGTFTPVVSGLTTAGTGTYTTQVGRYTKIGRLVQFQLRIAWTAHTGTGNMVIDQLPFVSSNVANSFSSVSIGYANGLALTASNIATAVVEVNASYVLLFQYPVGGGSATNVPVDTAADLMITGTYTV